MTGLSEVIGSWKTMPISTPQMSRNSASVSAVSSRPAKRTSPLRTTLVRGRSPMIERERTVLPEPDSPTTPRVRPRSRLKDTPSTARTMPRPVRKCVVRSATSSKGPDVSGAAG